MEPHDAEIVGGSGSEVTGEQLGEVGAGLDELSRVAEAATAIQNRLRVVVVMLSIVIIRAQKSKSPGPVFCPRGSI